MTFKEMVAADNAATFLNLDEFGEIHTVEGARITAVVDSQALRERQAGAELSVAEASLLLYAAAEDLPEGRAPGATLNVDGCEYIVSDWSVDESMATIALSGSRSI